MFLGLVTLLVALTISAVSAYYSIIGLTAIFAAAFWPIVIMGGALEAGKIVATLWLHYYWEHKDSVKLKLYLVPAVCILMFVTSMGVFGFLSKSHADQTLVSGDVTSQIQIFDEKIKTQRDNIEQSRKALTQMDAAVDQVMGRTSDENGALKSTNIRRSQAKERSRLQAEIEVAQKAIGKLQEERSPIAAQVRKVDAEVGPIKYIAALIYGDNPNQNLLESAVRWVIIIIVSVFDPLAIVLMLAAVAAIDWAGEEKEKNRHLKIQRKKEEKELAEIELEQNVRSLEELANIKLSELENRLAAMVVAAPPHSAPITIEKDYEPIISGAPVLDELDPTHGTVEKDVIVENVPEELDDPRVDVIIIAPPNLNPDNWKESFPTLTISQPQEITDLSETISLSTAEIVKEHDNIETLPPPDKMWEDVPETLPPPPKIWRIPPATFDPVLAELKATADTELGTQSHSGFGTLFPTTPSKGDTFIRVDFLPSKLFKWNNQSWIEVSKANTDSYAYNEKYVEYIVDQLSTGVYDIEDLSEVEQEQVRSYLTLLGNA